MFLAYVEQCLDPTLRRDDIVVMDNLPTHSRCCATPVPGRRAPIARRAQSTTKGT
jgi:hypothetical protein